MKKNNLDKIYYILTRPAFIFGKIKTRIFYKLFFGKIGRKSLIISPELLSNPSHIFIGDNVIIHSNARILCITDYNGQKFNPRIEIGDGVKIQQGFYMSCAKLIKIGDRVCLSQYTVITDTDHRYDDISKPVYRQSLSIDDIVIGEDSFIGTGVVILKGSKIGKHCIVGANAVVKGEFPDYCVIAGVPAKIIKTIKQ